MKKGIGYNFLVRLLIAIIALVAVFSIGASLFRITNSAEQSFNDFVNVLEDTKNWDSGKVDSIKLEMDKGTAIYGFGSGWDKIQRLAPNEPVTYSPFVLRSKFPGCEDLMETCICLCSDFLSSTVQDPDKLSEELCTGDTKCKTIGYVRFTEPILESKLIPFNVPPSNQKIKGGFVFYQKSPDGISVLRQKGSSPRQRAVYIEKGEGPQVGVCVKRPCLEKKSNTQTGTV